jgi:protein TonB
MVSLIDSAGQERVIAPPKRMVKPRQVPKAPPLAPVAKAPEPAPVETQPVDDALAPESSITLPRFNADYLNNPPPVYPTLARRLGEQGRVMLRVLVRADGTPAEVEINRSSGSARLDRAALDAVRKWRFIPAQQGDTPVTSPVLVPISFTLEG